MHEGRGGGEAVRVEEADAPATAVVVDVLATAHIITTDEHIVTPLVTITMCVICALT